MDQLNTLEGIILFEDGTLIKGQAAGYKGTSCGEVCFNTGMTGYQEVFTDPSYFGQILVTSNVHIGNYGTIDEDDESERVHIQGLICRNFSNEFSRYRASKDLQEYFERHKIVCIHNVDTRMIVKKIRSVGAMNCIVSNDGTSIHDLKSLLSNAPNMDGLELASRVSTPHKYTIGDDLAEIRIAVLDFGTKRNIIESLASRGCCVTVFPAKTPAEDIRGEGYDAYFLSNGPGDPSAMDYAINTVKKLLVDKKPVFGICLGHQILALANGVSTYKMHHGHRGINHPVLNIRTGQCEITTQNHGFSVKEQDILLHKDIEITHKNLNDNTVEGLRLKSQPAFSVQYHPESNPGPHDSKYLFDEFIHLIKSSKNN